MNEELIRMVPKPADRPAHVESIFSSDLNLTPEKRRSKSNDSRLKPKTKSPKKLSVPVLIEKHEGTENIPSPSCLVQPTINSSARISLKLHELQGTKFNPAVAIAEELQNSETARTTLAEKVASAVNVRKDQKKYTDLISLDLVPNDVIYCRTQQRAPFTAKGPKSQDNEPQIMDFFSDDFEEENAKFEFDLLGEEEEIPDINYEHAFDLYSRMSCWEHRWR